MAPNSESPRPPSSFPGIYKYPTKRDEISRGNPLDWIAAKRIDDDISELWRVRDKLYNLETFAARHPGGSDWITLTRGTDITEAFESSHVINVKSVESILEKYYVRPINRPRMSPYTFKPEGFYMTLKRKAEPILKEVGTGPTTTAKLYIDFLFAASSVLMFVGLHLNSWILHIIAGLILSLGVIASHNFFHIRQNWRSYYWDLSMLSSYEWRVSHALSHHLYPNTVMDAEVSAFEPVLQFLPSPKKSFFHRCIVFFNLQLTYFVLHLFSFGMRMKKVLLGQQKLRPENLLNIIQLLLCMYLSPSMLAGVKAWITMHTACSWLFANIGINAAHHHPDIFHDGDEARPDPDFGLCQLDAVRDRKGTIHENFFVQMVTFGEHSLHHLFPTVCHSKLHHLKGVCEETLEEFREKFPALTQWELYLGCLRQLRRCEPNKRKTK